MTDRTLVLGDPVIALGPHGVITDGAVVVEDTAISAVGPREQLQRQGPFQRVIGGAGSLVMPGLINCHYHSELAIGPGLYQFIFERANVHVHASYGPINEDDLHAIVQLGLVNAIRGGQTAAVDMFYGRPSLPHFGAPAALQAYRDIGFRVAFGLVSRDQNVYVHEPDEVFLARLPPALAAEVASSPMGYAWPVDSVMATYDHLVREWDGRDDRVRALLAPDWTPACSDELYRLCRRKADEYDTGITSHVLETRSEMDWNTRVNGMPALARLAGLGVLGPDLTCAHFVWVTDEELTIFADSGAVASNNPGSNLRLSSGICRTRDIMASGGRIAFGTDGISFSDSEDMFSELRLACYLQRDPRAFGEVRLDSEQVLRAAGENGARAIRREGRVGALSEGMLADLLVLDKARLFFPEGRYADTPALDVLLDRAQARDLRTVMIHGRIVMDDGRITVVDEQRLRETVAESVARRVYDTSDEVRRWGELGRLVEPAVLDFYRAGYERQVSPAQVFNAHGA
jgi:5-methylthioadenosine/S-adenosylhomocysteine deaminase